MAKNNQNHNDTRQKLILDRLGTDVGGIITMIYFRAALYRGDDKVSLAGLLQTTGIPCMTNNGVVIYGRGKQGNVSNVDRKLQAEYELYKRSLLAFSDVERNVLLMCGSNERIVCINAMAAR